MKRICLLAFALFAASFSFGDVVEAAIERVDFQPVVGGVTQPGFTAVTSNAAVLLPSGISIATSGLFFDRNPGFTNSGAFTYEDLLDDFAYAGMFANVGNAPVTLTIGNLVPLSDYVLRIFSADFFAQPSTGPVFATIIDTTYTPLLGTGGAAFSSSFNRTVNPSTNNQYSGVATLTSNATGQIVISIFGAPGGGSTANAFARLNGLELEAVVPEATSLAVWSLLAFTGCCLGGRRGERRLR